MFVLIVTDVMHVVTPMTALSTHVGNAEILDITKTCVPMFAQCVTGLPTMRRDVSIAVDAAHVLTPMTALIPHVRIVSNRYPRVCPVVL